MLMELVFQVGSVYGRKLCSVSTGSDYRFGLYSVVVGRLRFLSVALGSCRWYSVVVCRVRYSSVMFGSCRLCSVVVGGVWKCG